MLSDARPPPSSVTRSGSRSHVTQRIRALPLALVGVVLALIASFAIVRSQIWDSAPEQSEPEVESDLAIPGPSDDLFVPSEDLLGELTVPTEELAYETLSGLRPSTDRLFLMSVPGNFEAFDPLLVSLADGLTTEGRLGSDVWSGTGALSRLNPGEDRHPLVMVDGGVVLSSSRRILFQPTDMGSEPVDLGPGIAALPGPDGQHVWALSSGEKYARLISVATAETVSEADLTGLGRPVASAADGLILSVHRPSERNDFVYWLPSGSIVELAGTDGLAYLGSAGDTSVFGSASTMFVYNLADADSSGVKPLEGRSIALPVEEPWGSTVSPDGRLIALSRITRVTRPNQIAIVELESGEIIDTIDFALEYQYRWSGPNTLMYMQPEWPAFRLVERDALTNLDRNLLRFPNLNWWYGTTVAAG